MLFVLTACGSSNADKETSNTGAQQNNSTPETTDAPDETPENAPSEAPETSQPSDSGDTQSARGESGGSNILIAYFSRAGDNYNVGVIEKGNTEIIAEMIAEQTGGDLFHIETVTPYPEDYRECTNVAQ